LHKTVIFSLQGDFASDFVPDCPVKLCYLKFKLFSLTVSNFIIIFRLFDRKFNEDSKNVHKTVIFSLQVSFTRDFIPACPVKLCFSQFKLFSLTISNFVVIFRLFDRKFDEDSKNVLKPVIFSLQVDFTSDFVPDCSFKLCF